MGASHLATCVSKPSVLHHPYQTLEYSEAPRMFYLSPDIQEGQCHSQSPQGCHMCVSARVIQNDISFCRLKPSPIRMASVARVPRPWPDSNRPALIIVCPSPYPLPQPTQWAPIHCGNLYKSLSLSYFSISNLTSLFIHSSILLPCPVSLLWPFCSPLCLPWF